MPKKIQNTTKAHLISVPLPNHGASYTVISHQFVIDYAYQALANAGFGIVDEEYRCTADGQIAQGIYKLNFNNDPELSMMFAWTNSYNKQVKFKCVVGAYINNTGSVMISGEVGSWVRKHTGTADAETKDTIDTYIANAHMYYTQLCSDKAFMETVTLNRRKQSQLLGVLFAEYEILTTEQASMVRDQMKKPISVFANTDSLWAFYNHITIALQNSHPKTWMEDQRILHYFISSINNFPKAEVPEPVVIEEESVDPLLTNYGQPENQTNLLVQIAEETGDDALLKAQYPITPEGAFTNTPEVMEQAMKDELIFGVSGMHISEDGVRNMPIDEVLEKIREEDDIPDMLVQTEVLTRDEVLDRYGDLLTEEQLEIIEDAEEVFDHTSDLVVQYEDPAGNTFEAPVVGPCAAHDQETVKDIEEEFLDTEVQNFLEDVEPVVDTVELNENTRMAVLVTETVEDDEEDVFAEEDNFDLSFDDDTNEDLDSIPDFF
jgi:hypothetical protein